MCGERMLVKELSVPELSADQAWKDGGEISEMVIKGRVLEEHLQVL